MGYKHVKELNGSESMKIRMEHGAGGSEMEKLLNNLVLNNLTLNGFPNEIGLKDLDDGAVIPLKNDKLVLTVDSHTVDPIFFPGGNIGKLAISGTINDLAVMGSKPLALSNAMVIQEGFESKDLEKILSTMGKVSNETNVPIITGDTKVTDQEVGIIVTTAGIGLAEKKVIPDNNIKRGDKIIVSGPIGQHGLSIMSEREGLKFESTIKSDVNPVWNLVRKSLKYSESIHAMKDPTRGGVSNALNEMVQDSNFGILIKENEIPVNKDVKVAGEMLGINPMEVACEGRVLMSVDPKKSESILNEIKTTRIGSEAKVIGEVIQDHKGKVVLETEIGGKRYLERPTGDPVPRVC